MDPLKQFCPNSACPARGQTAQGNITIHDRRKQLYRCSLCQTTFSARRGTPFFRAHSDPALIALIITLITHGCPVTAVVAAWGFQPRTVRRWVNKAGVHAKAVHEQLVLQPSDLGQVQADEICAKTQRGNVWLAMAIAVPSRLWLGGVASAKRNKHLIGELLGLVGRCAIEAPLLFMVDGLSSYVAAVKRTFRRVEHGSGRGRPRLLAWPGLVLGQVIKRREQRRVVSVERRLVVGDAAQAQALLEQTQGGGVLNTAFIERINGTFRQRLAALGRRSRNLAVLEGTLGAGMYLIGTVYNFCEYHASLRAGAAERTPAMAAGITERRWSMEELLWYKVAPPRWRPLKQRGRRSKATQRLVDRWAA
jgi:transposase-like protein